VWGRRSALVLVPLLALFVGAAAAALVLPGVLGTGTDHTNRPVAAVAADTGHSAGVTLVAADYVGRPVDEVAAQLTQLGLVVQRQQDPTASAPAGTVTGVEPAGVQLRPGDPVVVSYAVPLGVQPAPHRTTRSTAVVRATTEAPAPTTTTAPTTAAPSTAAGSPTRTVPTTTPTTTESAPTTEQSTAAPSTEASTATSTSEAPSTEESTTSSGGATG
jgi:serine/threonine-protein kinase